MEICLGRLLVLDDRDDNRIVTMTGDERSIIGNRTPFFLVRLGTVRTSQMYEIVIRKYRWKMECGVVYLYGKDFFPRRRRFKNPFGDDFYVFIWKLHV